MKNKTFLIVISMMLTVITAKSQMWITQNVNPINDGYNFTSVSVVDSNIVWGVGATVDTNYWEGRQYISRTLDGGNTWISNALNTDWWVTSFQAFSADTAWMSTTLKSPVLTTNVVYPALRKTTDGGQTWIQNTNIPLDSNSFCDFIHFFNTNEGLAFGDVHNGTWEAYYTTDGGLNWSLADSVPNVINGEVVHDNTHYVLGNCIWATSTFGRVFYSFDKGRKWHASPVASFQFPQMFRVAFFDQLEGIAVRYNCNTYLTGSVYQTHNGGKSWTLTPHTGHAFLAYPDGGLFVVPGSHIVISNGGGVAKYGSSFSSDYGATWTKIDSLQRYGAIDGKGWNSLWAGQYSNNLGVGGIAKWNGSFLSINDLSSNVDFSVYPNPSNGKLNISSSGKIDNLEIINILGEIIYQTKPEVNNFSLQLDEAGIYFVRGISDKQILIKKLIVAH